MLRKLNKMFAKMLLVMQQNVFMDFEDYVFFSRCNARVLFTLDDTDVQTVSSPSQSRYMMQDTLHLNDIARNACKLHNL